jgi:hypothetical protein
MPKIAEVKLSSCGLRKIKYECGIAVADQLFLKSCGNAIVEVLLSSYRIAIADSKKVAHAHLCSADVNTRWTTS